MSSQGKQSIKVELNLDEDVLYIKVRDEEAKGLIKMSDDLYLEVGEAGSIVGIQLRHAKKHIVEGVAHRIKKLIEESGGVEEEVEEEGEEEAEDESKNLEDNP
ncbi:MAG: hypothetical protein DRJ68_04275 [Thermoprotei archaeon]|nr:MAG: hypothetical protein DRJ68_04275 [Thermoprotei archaeon]